MLAHFSKCCSSHDPTVITAPLLLCFATSVYAKSGPPIPAPELSISEAINLAKKHFSNKQTRLNDESEFKKEEYILVSAKYQNYFRDQKQPEWAWYISFVHPLANDHTITYKISNENSVYLIEMTE